MKISKILLLIITGIIIVCIAVFGLTKLMSNLDVIENGAKESFSKILEIIPPETKIKDEWYIESPDKEIQFIWTNSTIQMKVDMTPFINAGLDPSKINNMEDSWLYYSKTFTKEEKIKTDAIKQFEYILDISKNNLGYHTGFDHYGIALDNGNMFEWAKDINKNDKDIVFVLNPEPLIKAGVNCNDIEGWIYAKVQVMQNGKTIEVYKLLKVFDLN